MGWVKGTVIAAGVALTLARPATAATAVDPAPGPRARLAVVEQGQQRIVVPQIQVPLGDRAQLGVTLREVDEASAKALKLPAVEGALVERVEPGGAAEKAGIKPGDVIVSFDEERVRSARQLQRLVADTPPERAVKIAVVRDGRKTDVTATLTKASGPVSALGDSPWLGELQDRLGDLPRAFRYGWRGEQAPGDVIPREPRQLPPQNPLWDRRWPGEPEFPLNGWTSGAGRLGVVVQEMTPQLGDYFGAKAGVLVTSVTEGSPAAHAGLQAGDVITTVNGRPVKDADALLRAVRSQPDGEEMTIGIVRNHKPQTLKAKLLNATRSRPI